MKAKKSRSQKSRWQATHAGFYPGPTGWFAQRYWAHPRILVGGAILNAEDAKRLHKLGVTHVLSAENQKDDAGLWPDARLAYFPWEDVGAWVDGGLVLGLADAAKRFLEAPKSVLYTHCHLGGSRGPTIAYLVLRGMGRSPAEAMASIRAAHHNHLWTPHRNYIHAIEQALAGHGSNRIEHPLVHRNLTEAYKDTPTPMDATDFSQNCDHPTRMRTFGTVEFCISCLRLKDRDGWRHPQGHEVPMCISTHEFAR